MLATYFEIEIRVQRHIYWLVLVSHSRQSLASYWYKQEVWHLPCEFWQKADALSCLWKWQEVNAAKSTRSQGAEVPCVLILSPGFRGQGPLAACVYQNSFLSTFPGKLLRNKNVRWEERLKKLLIRAVGIAGIASTQWFLSLPKARLGVKITSHCMQQNYYASRKKCGVVRSISFPRFLYLSKQTWMK